MAEHLKVSKSCGCIQGLKRIDDALSSTSGAMLSIEKFDEVTRLRRTVRECCEAGREEEARVALARALRILKGRSSR